MVVKAGKQEKYPGQSYLHNPTIQEYDGFCRREGCLEAPAGAQCFFCRRVSVQLLSVGPGTSAIDLGCSGSKSWASEMHAHTNTSSFKVCEH